ncbi:hypothetical protein [Prevotella sp. tf2-5]|uniref:hypothetical protein n=1 Tax=Prevotella sp. tf2-5 TaxID=1761889 RepID=UPI0008E3166B|nr:hypothetical protein [Prevotella sp. tf2-5]SFO61870.1 hypothetical protein SAMN04487852_103280 [Prevotella sp. tf2-5]
MAGKKFSEDEVKLIIDAESAKAQQAIHELEKESKNLREENKARLDQMLKLEAAGQKESAYYKSLQTEYTKTRKKINDNSKAIAEHTSRINVNCKSMNQLKKEASQLRRQLNETVQSLHPEEYAKLEKQLQKVEGRISDLKQNAKSLKEIFTSDNTIGFLTGTFLVKTAESAVNTVKNLIGSVKEMVDESVEMARSADGVTHAFEKLDRQDLLDNLRKATKGTINDVELMKSLLQAKDFRIPLEDMGKYLQFAQLKAQQTGQSVEYMTNSIVTGLGRKSVMILDNLGISASEVNERTKQMGSFMKAVASIVDEELASAGETYVSAADRMAQRTVRLQNAQKELGDELLPLKEKFDDVYGEMQIGTIDLIKWMIQHRDVVAALTVAVIGLTLATAANSTAVKENIVVTKGAAAVSALYKNVITTLKGLLLLLTAGYLKSKAAILSHTAATNLATAANTRAAAAMRLFNAACKANVIGLVITGLIAAITYFGLFSDSAEDAKEKTSELAEEEKRLKSVRTEADGQLKKDIATLKNFTGTKKQEIELVKQMNSRYGESIGYYKTVSEWYNALIKNSKLYCDQMVIEAQTRQIANQIAELEQQKYDIRFDKNGNKKKYSNRRATHHYMTGKTEVEQSDADKAQAQYNDLNSQSRAQQKRLEDLEKKRLANAKTLHTGASVDPFGGTSNKNSGNTNKEDNTSLKEFKRARQAELDAEKAVYEEQLVVHKKMLAEKKMTREEYDSWVLASEAAYKESVLKIEEKYRTESQNLSLKDTEKKKEILSDQQRNVEKAASDSNQAQLRLYEQYQQQMNHLRSASMSEADREKADRDAQLAVLDAYYKASLQYAEENKENTLAVDNAYFAAREKLEEDWRKKDEERKFRARSSAGLTTVQEELQYGMAGIDANTDLSPEEKNRAKENLEREHQERLLQIRQEYGLVKQQELYDMELEQLRLAHEQGMLSEEEYEEAKKNMKMQKWKESFDYYHGLFSNAVSALQDAELANVDAKYDAEIEAARKAGKDTTKLEEKKAREQLEIQKKYADINFAIKASQIIADTATSIMKAYADLGPIAGSIAAALMGVTGIAQLMAANAERQKVKRMTLNGGSSSSSASAERVATGKEEGGFLDVEREQDGKRFHAKYDPRRRGYVDRPTVIVGEGPVGQSKEWIASNAAVENPTVRPVLDVLDRSQRAGTIRTLDLNKFLIQHRGFAEGGSVSSASLRVPPTGFGMDPELMERFIALMERMERNGIPAHVGLDEIDNQNKLLEQSRNIGSK